MTKNKKSLYLLSSLLLIGSLLTGMMLLAANVTVAQAQADQPLAKITTPVDTTIATSPTTPTKTTVPATTTAPATTTVSATTVPATTTAATTSAPVTTTAAPATTTAVATTAPATTASPCDPHQDLRGSLSGATGTIVNSSATCSYEVGMASYKWMDQDLDNQVLYSSATNRVGPKHSVRLSVGLPNCKAQIDLFYGPVLTSFNGQYYGQRNLATNNTSGAYCAQVTRAPSTTAPATRAPNTPASTTAASTVTPASTTAPVTTPAATTTASATTAPATTPALTTAASPTTPGGAGSTTVAAGSGPAVTTPFEVLGEAQGPVSSNGGSATSPNYRVEAENAIPAAMPMTGNTGSQDPGFVLYLLIGLSGLLALSLVSLLIFSKRRIHR